MIIYKELYMVSWDQTHYMPGLKGSIKENSGRLIFILEKVIKIINLWIH